MNIKKFSMFAIVAVMLVFFAASALALTANDLTVKMDDRVLSETSTNNVASFEKNEEFPVVVLFELAGDEGEVFEDVQVEARIRGYDQKDLIEDITNAFDVVANVQYKKTLDLKLPVRMDPNEQYRLRISIVDGNGDEITETYTLLVESDAHAIWIKDIVLSPENEVQAGRALLATVRLKNIGNEDEDEGIRVKVSIPELGLSATDYIDSLDEDESVTSEELYMRIPTCPKLGTYDVFVEVTYQDGDETETAVTSIDVVGSDLCEVPTQTPVDTEPSITAGVDVQNVVPGQGGAIYPITVTNNANTAKTFTIMTEAENWATIRVSPSNVLIVEPGQTETAYVYVSAHEDALVGQNLFAVTVKAGNNVVEQFTLTANVVPGDGVSDDSWDSLRKTLEIGLVVLVIILVILGLVIGLRRMRKDGDDDESQTYY